MKGNDAVGRKSAIACVRYSTKTPLEKPSRCQNGKHRTVQIDSWSVWRMYSYVTPFRNILFSTAISKFAERIHSTILNALSQTCEPVLPLRSGSRPGIPAWENLIPEKSTLCTFHETKGNQIVTHVCDLQMLQSTPGQCIFRKNFLNLAQVFDRGWKTRTRCVEDVSPNMRRPSILTKLLSMMYHLCVGEVTDDMLHNLTIKSTPESSDLEGLYSVILCLSLKRLFDVHFCKSPR